MKYRSGVNFDTNDTFVGWGNKASSLKAKQLAKTKGVAFCYLEDGFIAYIGHPAQGGKSISVVSDPLGIYYDNSQPSRLEKLIVTPKSVELLARTKALIEQIRRYGITKYNCYPIKNSHKNLPSELDNTLAGQRFVLLVDQVAGDLSLSGANADESHFLTMLEQARQQYPEAKLVIRTHPDTRFGKKSSVLAGMKQSPAFKDVIWFEQACHPHALIHHCQAVFTVSSQMGFEALLLGKPVHCFGLPFYAAWGLTQDYLQSARRCLLTDKKVSVHQLATATLIEYPKYFNPNTGKNCEVEEVIELLRLQQHQAPKWNQLYLVGFSLWKQAFIRKFCGHLACKLNFVSQVPKQVKHDEMIAVWGNKFPHLQQVIRIEDGFIRSTGLGSNFSRPSSLVLDDIGIYFNAQADNRLQLLLREKTLTSKQIERAKRLITLLLSADINKYNLGCQQQYTPKKTDKKRLLVVGQVDADASIVTGSPVITSNETLLWAVRQANPNAYIIYKPHPDVVAGNRQGQISVECQTQCVDEQVTRHSLGALYPYIDALHTMTSLSGFEALLRNIPVVTWGCPFYAGWGLTTDMLPTLLAGDNAPSHSRFLCSRFSKRSDSRILAFSPSRLLKFSDSAAISLEKLIYISLIMYPKYIDWETGLSTSPEWLIEKMATNKVNACIQQSKRQRWHLKFNYLLETLCR